ncbi:MAG: acyl-CoA dehydrogenase family protein [Myxococcota bacterium]|nr:acyl-CoA dehydrogenase family protein [Myxococcota bacterium]
MNFAFTEEQEELRETARAFLADQASSESVRAAMASENGWDDGLWQQLGSELGWTAVQIPEEYGGLGLGYVEFVALLEIMGEHLVCSPYFATLAFGANAILVAGSEEQKQELLPPIAEGECTATLALTEASGRWDARGIEVVCTRDGDEYVLSGAKRYVVDGDRADLLIVAARAEGSEGEEGISLFAIPADTAGIERKALPTVDQTRRQAEIQLAGVRVPVSARLGEEGGAWPSIAKTLDLAGIALAAEQVGGAQRCLDQAVAYANERVQFGRVIGSFQSIKHKCADMMVSIEAGRSAIYYAACVAAEDSDELPSVASLAQSFCSDAYFRCAADSIQIHGGVGFTWEYDCHMHFKRAKSSETLLGDPAYHRELVARRIGI